MKRWALFSPCGDYRYVLGREWDADKPRVLFDLLNPSTADAEMDDPTNRRGIDFSQRWGFGSCIFVNLFGWRSPHPKIMMAQEHPIGIDNDMYVLQQAYRADLIVCAWGNDGKHMDRAKTVERMFRNHGHKLHHLGRNKNGKGEPKHILYLSSKLRPTVWDHG